MSEAQWLKACFEFFQGLPRNYLVIDTETNHINQKGEKTWITQAGYVIVQDGKIVTRQGFCLTWDDILSPEDTEIYYTGIDKVADAMRLKGRPTPLTSTIVRQFGHPSRVILANLHELLSDALQQYPIVGFNIIGFDIPLIERIFHTYHQPLRIPTRNCIDVGMIEKGLVSGQAPPDPRHYDLTAWYEHMRRAYCRAKWNLSEHCLQKYLGDRLFELDIGGRHTADYDCELTHLVLEEMRKLAEAA
jgi:DNA polymerase III epsilon subunit-like protein